MSINHSFVIPKKKSMPKHLQNDPLASPSISMIVGPTGSGKSTVLANLLMALQDRHKFDSGLFVTSNNRDNLLESIEMNIVTTPAELDDWITKTKQAEQGTNHILVLDDIQSSKDFNIMLARSLFSNFLLSHRHYGSNPKKPNQNGVWIILTAQTLKNSYSPVIRDNVKNWFIFYPRKPADAKLYEDIAQNPVAMRRAMTLVKNEGKYSFLYLNKNDPTEDKYFLGFDKELKDL